MKSSLKKLKGGLARHKSESKEKRDHQPSAQLDELAQATQDMQDMRNCYDSLLSAAAATANSAYEFSVSLREMGACLLEKTSLNDDEESGRVLLMLGKVQYELQKLVDSYRSHIFQTITNPSESLLNELRTVEEMKRQCDEKRSLYDYMVAAKGKSRHTKRESFTSQQLQSAREEYDDEATLFVFRLKSLKQGQSRSLVTQAARHHAAQLMFFRKGLKSLEAVEPHIKLVTELQHIDYQFNGLEDDDAEDGDEYDGSDANDEELSFDYGQIDCGQDAVSPSRNSMELDQVEIEFPLAVPTETAQENQDKNQRNLPVREPGGGSKSAPIFPERKFDASEKITELRPSRKFHTYVLPTPVDAKSVNSSGSGNPDPGSRQASISGRTQNLWHSSPLEPKKHTKDLRDNPFSDTIDLVKAQSVLKESNMNNSSSRKSPPLAEGPTLLRLPSRNSSDTKKIKRQAFSGPLTGKHWSGKPAVSTSGPISSLEHPLFVAGMLARVPVSQPAASHKVSPNSSPPLLPSPKISELHELPRPPIGLAKPTSPSSLVGHSAPILSKSQELSTKTGFSSRAAQAASPLPRPPPGTMPRSFSIPSSGQKAQALETTKFLEAPPYSDMTEEVASPPLTPIPFPTTPATSDVVNRSRKPKGVD